MQFTLRMARESNGYTLEEVASRCGIPVGDIARYELDARGTPFDVAKKLKRLYCIELGQIFVGLESEFLKNKGLKRA